MDKNTEEKIARFCDNEEIAEEHLAMLAVGYKKGDDPKKIMRIITGSILLRFHGIPIKYGSS